MFIWNKPISLIKKEHNALHIIQLHKWELSFTLLNSKRGCLHWLKKKKKTLRKAHTLWANSYYLRDIPESNNKEPSLSDWKDTIAQASLGHSNIPDMSLVYILGMVETIDLSR